MTDDTTTARRALLGLLLSRAERGVLTDADRKLLRPLVEAEMATLDQIDTWTAEPQQPADALYEVVSMLQAIGTGTWAEAIECVEARAMAHDRNGGRALALAGRTVSSEAAWQAALDKANAETARRERQYTAEYIRAQQAETERDRLGRVLARVAELRFAWEQYDALDPQAKTMLAELIAALGVFRCSPLVNADCPGHTDGGRCERAASNPAPAAALIEETGAP